MGKLPRIHPNSEFWDIYKTISDWSVILSGPVFAFLCSLFSAMADMSSYGGKTISNQWMVFVANSAFGAAVFSIWTYSRLGYVISTVKEAPLLIFFIGGLQTVGQYGMIYGATVIGPGKATALYYTIPIFTILLNWLILGEAVSKWHYVLTAMSVLGVALTCGSMISQPDNPEITHPGIFSQILACGVILVGAAAHSGVIVARKMTADRKIDSFIFMSSFYAQYLPTAALLCTVNGSWSIPDEVGDVWVLMSTGVFSLIDWIFLLWASLVGHPSTVSIILTSTVAMAYGGQTLIFDLPIELIPVLGAVFVAAASVGVAIVSLVDGSGDAGGASEMSSEPAISEQDLSDDESSRLVGT